MSNYFASVPKTEASDFLINSWQGFYFFLFDRTENPWINLKRGQVSPQECS